MSLALQIENYKASSKNLKRDGHIQMLKSIGETLDEVVPSQVSDKELKNLEYALGNLKKTMAKEEGTRDTQIDAINVLIAKVSYLSQKNPSRRSEKMNLDILKLGKQLTNLANILSKTIIPIILQSLIDQFFLN